MPEAFWPRGGGKRCAGVVGSRCRGIPGGLWPPLLLLFLITSGIPAHAADDPAACRAPFARIVSIQGTIEVLRASQSHWSKVTRLDTPLCEGDRLRTGVLSRAALFIQPETLVRVDQNTSISVSQTKDDTLVEFTQEEVLPAAASAYSCGAGYFITRFPRKFRVNTPHLNAAVEGTEFLVAMRCEATELSVFEGKVLAEGAGANIFPSQSISSGQILTIGEGEPPAVRLLVKPKDAVQWVLYYPPLSDAAAEADLPSAEQCRSLPKPLDQTCLTQRAEVHVRLGRVDEAQREVDEAVALDSGHGDANALRAIISIARNDKSGAIEAATAATKASQNSYRAWLALSYAQQASFKLDDSLVSARKAQALEPISSVTNARVAELLMSLGRIKEAEVAARAAVDANPIESRAHTVLGFVHLAQIKTKDARSEFLAAIERDSSDPLPRLGLGLSVIREGKLVEGREQLEIAVALDPTNSLLRSYVGKAYYEENRKERNQLAETQFELAKQLDPNDPTPWFYAAILKQAQSRPVEALKDLQQSIERNDDRAVYRSQLLLDEDKASRAIDLARTYRELGIEQRARLEAARSLSYDQGSVAAHKFLADVYASLPRHDIARQSENLQAQLRQPASFQSMQPDLTTADRFAQGILRDTGPTRPGLYEFNPLFVRNGFRFEANGITGENDTWGDQLTLSGLQDRLAFSLSQLAYNTDGFRTNNDLSKRLHNAFLQYDFSTATSMQLEARTFETKQGDPFLRFDPNLFFSDRGELNGTYVRFGARQQLRPQTDVFASLIYVDATNPAEIPGVLGITQDFITQSAEIQINHHGSLANLAAGIGYYAEKKDVNTSFGFTAIDTINARNAYLYASIYEFAPGYTLQVGASYDYIGAEVGLTEAPQEEFSPKLGVIWDITSRTTLRAAAFKVLKRRLLTSQTLEPTQVGGFNQFFDDPEGTVSWHYGIGLDHKFSALTLTGIEVSNRDLKPPQGGTIDLWHEVNGRAYFHWLPTNWLATSLRYEYEKLDRDANSLGPDLFAQTETQIIPLTITTLSHSGLSASITASYVEQKGVFATAPFFSGIAPGSDAFWITDFAMTFRLPRRLGFISVEARNLFNEKFQFQETDVVHPQFARDRLLLLHGSLAF